MPPLRWVARSHPEAPEPSVHKGRLEVNLVNRKRSLHIQMWSSMSPDIYQHSVQSWDLPATALVVGICRTGYRLWHNRAARSVGYDFRLFPPLDLLDSNLAFDQLVDVCHNCRRLDIHQRERWYWVPTPTRSKSRNSIEVWKHALLESP